MTAEEWQAIAEAREMFGLADRATLGEIKRAYHRLCKQYHPDVSGQADEVESMHRLTRFYELLMRYCNQYRIPLTPEDNNHLEPEDWWMDRFGQDPLWGKNKGKA